MEADSLSQKLDHDLEAFIEAEVQRCKELREKNPQPEQTVDEILEELSRHPAFLTEIDYTKPLHPATEALIALEYEVEDKQERAEKYKNDGNDNFKKKRYHWAIDNYTEAIKSNCTDRLTNAIIYSNRAAANYHLGNYRTSLNDAIIARKFIPNHLKAVIRGALSCHKLKRFDDCLMWCDAGLLIEKDNKSLLDLKVLCSKDKKLQERDHRKQTLAEKLNRDRKQKLFAAIKSRQIKLAKQDDCDIDETTVDLFLACHHPDGRPVSFAEDDKTLVWPVMFLYPEYAETDFIQAMNENDRFADHIDAMFGAHVPAATWDLHNQYSVQNIKVYFKDYDGKLVNVDTSNSLLQVLQHKRYELHGGVPTFILLSQASKFYDTYLQTTG